MLRGYQRPVMLEPISDTRFQGKASLTAGLIAGVILLMMPSGSPWSGVIFLAPVIMGRTISPHAGLPIMAIWIIHILLALVYGVIISLAASRFRRGRALLAGAITAAFLYLLNYAIVSAFWPGLRGNEGGVAFSHIVFGLIAAGAYRGLLKRKHVHVTG